jgi:starch synthase
MSIDIQGIANHPRTSVPSNGFPIKHTTKKRRPKILIVTPELSESRFLSRNGKPAPCVKAGGLADMSALLIDSLTDAGAEVHVAMPHFHALFQPGNARHSRHLHLCQDREFSYRRSVYEGCSHSNLRGALAFQRDVIHYVLPRLRPDLVHCHDWMTGLVPAAAKTMGIPSIFTLHNHHDEMAPLCHIEDRGIDAARFWRNLYYQNYPESYESARNHNSVSFLASGIMAADVMNTVSNSFLSELADGAHGAPRAVVNAVREKVENNEAYGILNSLRADYGPEQDHSLAEPYDGGCHISGKRTNKRVIQKLLGLEQDDEAPMLFWPSRLDPAQKGCQLLADILYQTVSDYWALGLQVVFVADGPFRCHFENIVKFHDLGHRIAVRGFDPRLSRQVSAASDFTLMPSAYEPCGLAQMIGLRYGSLPIVHATGGLRDTIQPLNCGQHTGNGFVFEVHDPGGLRWAIDEAIRFFIRPAAERNCQITRIMTEARESFLPHTMISQYQDLYQKLLK